VTEERLAQAAIIEKFDAQFELWKKDHPGGSFAVFSAEMIVRALNKGVAHDSLGQNLKGERDFRTTGLTNYQRICQMYVETVGAPIFPPDLRVCDYGCGTLRAGVHFIHSQQAGCYFGLDVDPDLLEIARKGFNDSIVAKQATLGLVTSGLAAAKAAKVQLLFTANVVCHVHPDDAHEFYYNIRQIASEAGSVVMLHGIIADRSFRFQKSGWAHSLAYYEQRMIPFSLVGTKFVASAKKFGEELSSYYMIFRRD